MKKYLFFFLFCAVCLNTFAFEGGGLFSTEFNFILANSKKGFESAYFNNPNRLSLWMKQNIDKEGFYNFSAQGSAYFKIRKLLAKNAPKVATRLMLDIDTLKFSFFIPINSSNNISIDVGRRGVADSTSLIMSQSFDGVFAQYKSAKFNVMASLAFTTLLNANLVVLNEDSYKPSNSVYALPKSYAALMAMFQIPILKTSYSINLDTLNFFETKKDGKMKLYLTAGVKGPIVRRLFFSVSASPSFVREQIKGQNKWNVGIMATGAIAYYFQKYNAKLGANIQYASGGKNNFQSFTVRHISPLFFSPYTNILNIGAKGSIKPIKELYIQATMNLVFKGRENDGKRAFYEGFEWNASTSYTIMHDITLEASLGQFIRYDASMQTFIGIKGIIAF